jgi:hypothetical protein
MGAKVDTVTYLDLDSVAISSFGRTEIPADPNEIPIFLDVPRPELTTIELSALPGQCLDSLVHLVEALEHSAVRLIDSNIRMIDGWEDRPTLRRGRLAPDLAQMGCDQAMDL